MHFLPWRVGKSPRVSRQFCQGHKNDACLYYDESTVRISDELEVALLKEKGFEIVTRERLADLQKEGQFAMSSLLAPGTGVEKISVEGVEGIVRGRYYPERGGGFTVFAELVWLKTGKISKTKILIPYTEPACARERFS